MPIVITVDQRASRRSADLVDSAIDRLHRIHRPLRAFQRTAGDEFQGVLGDASAAVEVALALVRQGTWSIGIGVGPVRTPMPRSARAGAGPAFEHARVAVERAKRHQQHLAVVGEDSERARDAQVVLALLAAVVERRTDAGWEAVDLAAQGHTMSEIATRLDVTRQAVGQRLATAQWQLEREARPLAARLLQEVGA